MKYVVRLYTDDGIKQHVLESREEITTKIVRDYFRVKYNNAAVLTLDKCEETELIAGIYIGESDGTGIKDAKSKQDGQETKT